MKTEYKREIFEALKDIGVPANGNGYYYISSIVESYLTGVYKPAEKITFVYADMAKYFNTTPSRLERCIRHAVEYCSLNTDINILYKYFGNSMDRKSGKLCNSAFLLGVVEYIKVYAPSATECARG